MRNSPIALFSGVLMVLIIGNSMFTLPSNAQDKTAEELVASKKKADMSYKQLMQIMGSSLSTINHGIIVENKQMVQEGANFILGHPAPSHKPWTIMEKSDQAGFKETLIEFDQLLDEKAKAVASAAKAGDWLDANEAASDLSNTCISCHGMWKNKVK
jgi:cytochrome c553